METNESDVNTLTIAELLDKVTAGYKEWGENKENFIKFIHHFRSSSGASLEYELALSQLIELTSFFDGLEDRQPFITQIITLVSLGYFLALREYRLLEKDLN